MERRTFFVPNGQGWELGLKRSCRPDVLDVRRRPVVILPGYGMNSYVFGYHPGGTSMIDTWVERGHEVWTVDLRGQGAIHLGKRPDRFGLAELAKNDLRVAFDFVVEHSRCQPDTVIGVGCSLGGALLYAHVGCVATHRLGAVVGMGAPLRWEAVHPFFRAVSRAPGLARLAGHLSRRSVNMKVLPLIAQVPGMISLYLHPEMVDLTHPERLFLTVSDLLPQLNEEMAHWMARGDLVLDGQNVTEAFWRSTMPLLCVLGVGDGVVPEAAALSACRRASATAPCEVLRVGDPARPYAHADLFVARQAPQDVFLPVARWLETQGQLPGEAPGAEAPGAEAPVVQPPAAAGARGEDGDAVPLPP
ncbi:MAG: hypothetical protein FJ125_01960 [Deltaproteobacteria bacterium]|nr:hypothetical protein [Deltaproteobacteria bacterium]